MKIVINPTYEVLREWITTLPERFAHEGEVIYDARNQIRLMTAPDGKEYCVKRFHAPRSLNRWIYSFLRAPKAVRAYENALRLRQAGIGTPEVIGYILVFHRGLLSESYLVSLRSVLTRDFYEFRHHPLAGYEDIVCTFALFTAKMHEKGILHKDYSPGNILFDRQPDGSVSFEIVDVNRMQFGYAVSIDNACRNFCRLWGQEDFFTLLAQEYARARGWDEQQCVRLTLRYWRRFWRHRT
ncbi:MAG: tyrosine protein kinase [Paludibacteraceae bacterium]|nr:tyrosine protein kinase [Paludibacteraceae bacterium]